MVGEENREGKNGKENPYSYKILSQKIVTVKKPLKTRHFSMNFSIPSSTGYTNTHPLF